jgi:site-specific DNA recombinase
MRVDRALWDKVHRILQESPRQRAANTRNQTPALLRGLIFGPNGTAMTPTMTKKGSRLYRPPARAPDLSDFNPKDASAADGAPGGLPYGLAPGRMEAREPRARALADHHHPGSVGAAKL